jgi:hypothetical protein
VVKSQASAIPENPGEVFDAGPKQSLSKWFNFCCGQKSKL